MKIYLFKYYKKNCIVVNCQTRMKNEALWHSQNINLFDDISTTVSTNGGSLEAGLF